MAEKLTQVELDSIQLHGTKPRSLYTESLTLGVTQEDDVETGHGQVHVVVQGDRTKQGIITYHDIGLNSNTCFGGYFSFPDMQEILKHFCVYHVNAPGQTEGSLPLPQGYQYPTMDELAEMLNPVMQYYGLKSVIGFGVGAGANILARFAVRNPEKVEGLALINCTAGKAGWTEWGYQKLNSWHLKSGSVSTSVEEYLLWHWFGKKTMAENHDLVTTFSAYIRSVNPTNLSHFIESYIKRSDLGIHRPNDPKHKTGKYIKCPVMLVAGSYSPHLDDTVNMNTRMDIETCQWMKFQCGGMVMEEAPEKLSEALRLFLQGMGYVPSLSQTKLVHARQQASRDSISHPQSSHHRDAHAPNDHQQAVC